MKNISVILLLLLTSMTLFAQSWTDEELFRANTAANESILSKEEKDVILYCNLARMYPRRYIEIELKDHRSTSAEKSLIKRLKSMSPLSPIIFSHKVYDFAKARAVECGERGLMASNKSMQSKKPVVCGENSSYGTSSGQEIVRDWLICDGSSSYRIRENCLGSKPMYAAAGIAPHQEWGTVCILEFCDRWQSPKDICPDSPQWTEDEIASANTAADVDILTPEEKNVILYCNLARMYPRRYIEIELAGYKETSYEKSLIKMLKSLTPMGPLHFDYDLYRYAKAWAIESGELGVTGHNRRKSPELPNNTAENCDYGHDDGESIINCLLIDEDVPSLGHRYNCLDPDNKTIGTYIAPHTEWDYNCVLDFCTKTSLAK